MMAYNTTISLGRELITNIPLDDPTRLFLVSHHANIVYLRFDIARDNTGVEEAISLLEEELQLQRPQIGVISLAR